MTDTSSPTVALGPLTENVLYAERYELLERVGEGGMGVVFRARDTELDEIVALKILHRFTPTKAPKTSPALSSGDAALERFRREVKLARRVTHPNVARTFDLGRAGQERFLTMEFISGAPLAAWLSERKALGLAHALRLATEIAKGLAAAHAAGVVHRDLKPDNVMLRGVTEKQSLRGDEGVVITDFGIAYLAEEQKAREPRLTQDLVIGTPEYMAPEQVRGEHLDGRADVFALGVMLFELLTGKLPFNGKTPVELAAARLLGRAPELRTVEPGVPAGLSELVGRMLCSKRDDRPDAQHVLEQLELLRGGAHPRMSLGKDPAGSQTPTTASVTSMAALDLPWQQKPKLIAVLPFFGTHTPELTRDLAQSIADTLTSVRGLQVLPPGVVSHLAQEHRNPGGTDFRGLGKFLGADRVIEGTVQQGSTELRVSLRVVETNHGHELWARSQSTAFAPGEARVLEPGVEDKLATALVEHLRGSLQLDQTPLPQDPSVRALYERSRLLGREAFDSRTAEEAVALLRQAQQLGPDEPLVLSALAVALLRYSTNVPEDGQLLSEAEDWALRALSLDDTLADTYTAIGFVRLQQGDHQAAVRAYREALVRNPRNLDAQAYLGRFLVECGHFDEGLRRLEFAVRLEPYASRIWNDLARAYFLKGTPEQGWRAIHRAEQVLPETIPTLAVQARMMLWYKDSVRAGALLARIAESTRPLPPALQLLAMPVLQALRDGTIADVPTQGHHAVAKSIPALSNRAFVYQLLTELHAAAGRTDACLETLELLATLPLIDVAWLDRCPLFSELREHPRFATVRAAVSLRGSPTLADLETPALQYWVRGKR